MLRYWYQCTVCLNLCVGQKDISALQLCSVKGLLLVFHMVLLLASCLLPQVQKVVDFSTPRNMSQHGALVAWAGRKAMEDRPRILSTDEVHNLEMYKERNCLNGLRLLKGCINDTLEVDSSVP